MLEKNLIKKFMEEVKKKHPSCWFFKSHGQPMQVRGIPDIILCFYGIFVGIEFKIIRDFQMKITPYQQHTLEEIHNAGGFPVIVWYHNKQEKYGVLKHSFNTIKKAVDFFCEECFEVKKNLIISE